MKLLTPSIVDKLIPRDEAGKAIAYQTLEEISKSPSENAYVRANSGQGMQIEMRDVDESKLQIEFVISSFKRDDYGTRFDPHGCDMSQYRMNPVVMYRHMRDSGIYTLPIARGLPETFSIDGEGKMHMVAEFTPEETFDFGFQVYKMVKDGFLNMASIGAQIVEWKNLEEKLEDDTPVNTVVFTKWKLFEWSVVPIGANDDALVSKRMNELEETISSVDEERMTFFEAAKKPKPKPYKVLNVGSISVIRSDDGKGIVTIEEPGEAGTTVTYCREGIEIPESDRQRDFREFYEKFSPVSKHYRSLMDRLYKRLGVVKPDNEEEAITRLLPLVLSPQAAADTIPASRRSAARQMMPQDLQKLAAQLAAAVEEKRRAALVSGTPLSKIESLIPVWTQEAIDSISSPS